MVLPHIQTKKEKEDCNACKGTAQQQEKKFI